MKSRKVHSQVLQHLLDKMDKDPWYIKFRRYIKVQIWVYTCLTRKYWDKSFEGYIYGKERIKYWKNIS